MRRRVLAALAGLGLAVTGLVVVGASTAQAAGVPAAQTSVTTFGCQGPEKEVSQAAAKVAFESIDPAKCLSINIVDKCDGTTVITMTNWAFNDNKFTVLTVEILGKEYTLKGGSDPNTEVVTVGPPGVEDLQIKLVFRFTTPDGEVTFKKNYGDPWTWELPEACPTASPTPSAVPTSTVPTTSTPTTTGPAVVPNDSTPDLPVTGAALQGTLYTGGGLVLLAGALIGYLVWRRRREENPAVAGSDK